MNALDVRREEDVRKLKALEQATNGRVKVVAASGSPISTINLRFSVRTAADEQYPARTIATVDATIQLASRYPFDEPSVTVTTKVFNPNIYTNGRVCLGSKWLPTEYLDLLAQRLFKILAFDDSIINASSAANGEAARWYVRLRNSSPQSFPSDSLNFAGHPEPGKIRWTEKIETPSNHERTLVECPHCRTKVRLPVGRSGTVNCPTCKKSFDART